jgi:hypothetical protein
MAKHQTETPEQTDWQTVPELPPAAFAILRKADKAFNPIAVVATLALDGSPHTAPFGSLRAVTPRSLRLICFRLHDTYTNLCRDERVIVAVLAPPDVAVSIRGRARVIKERMDSAEDYAIVTIDIEEVKNDMVRLGVIKSATTFSPADDVLDRFSDILGELENV